MNTVHPIIGKVVHDTITGFTGVVIGRTEWLHGCVRIGVESQELKDGKPIEIQWFDEARCELTSAAPGGPERRDPSSRRSGGGGVTMVVVR